MIILVGVHEAHLIVEVQVARATAVRIGCESDLLRTIHFYDDQSFQGLGDCTKLSDVMFST